jgi:tetratricopeptide (TPR) repeat protein
MEQDMNLIQQRRLAKLSKLNAQKEAGKPANKGAKGDQPVMSKMRQKLQEQKAASEKRAAEKLVAKDAAEKLKSEKTDDLENQVDGVEGSVDELKTDLEKQGEKSDELAGTVDELSNDLDNVKDGVSDLDGRLDWVENDIEKIKEKLQDDSEYIGNPELETHKATMANAIDEMKKLEDLEDRASYKAEAIKRVEDFVIGYVQSAAKYPNIVAVWMMIFLFDLGDIAKAVPLALHLAKQKTHRMPTRFNSSIYQFIGDYVYDWAAKQLEANKSAGPYLEQVINAIESDKWQLSDIVHGKMYAMYGKHLEVLGEDEAALNAFERAMTLNERAGVKKKIERLTARLAKTVKE